MVEEEDEQNRERLTVGGSVKTKKRKSHRIKKSKGGNRCKTRKH
jgi:hypothetical protein